MRIEIENVSPVTRKIVVSIPLTTVMNELNQAYRSLQQEVHMRGFRPGRVPRAVLEGRFRTQVEGEVRTKLITESLEHAVESNNLMVVSEPVIEPGRLSETEDFTYTATLEIKPEVEAKEYKGLELTREKYALEEGPVDRQLAQLREQKANLVVVEEVRPVADGDIARIEYVMWVDGKPYNKGQVQNTHVLVQMEPPSFLPGFAAEVIGMQTGEKKTFELAIPADFRQSGLAGKSVKMQVTLHDIKRQELPELDDELAKDLNFENLEALKENIRGDLRKHLEESSLVKVRREIAEKLIEHNEVELPPGLVSQQIEAIVREQYRQMGRPAPKGKIQLSEEQRAELSKEASFRLKASLILDSISQQEKIEVTDEDLNARLAEIAKELGRKVEAVRGQYMKNNAMEELKARILEEKTLDFVLAAATINEVEKAFDDHAHDHVH